MMPFSGPSLLFSVRMPPTGRVGLQGRPVFSKSLACEMAESRAARGVPGQLTASPSCTITGSACSGR
jgi:hypothetical protein